MKYEVRKISRKTSEVEIRFDKKEDAESYAEFVNSFARFGYRYEVVEVK